MDSANMRLMVTGYPLAMLMICLLSYPFSRGITRHPPEVFQRYGVPSMTYKPTESPDEPMQAGASAKMKPSTSSLNSSAAFGTHYTTLDIVLIYAVTAASLLNLYLYHRFGMLTVLFGSEDFSAKMAMALFTIIWALMPLGCICILTNATQVNLFVTARMSVDEANQNRAMNITTSEESIAADWEEISIQQPEKEAAESERFVKCEKGKGAQNPVPQNPGTALPLSLGVLEFIAGSGTLSLLLPLVRLLFA